MMFVGTARGRAKSGENLVAPWYYNTDDVFLDRFKISAPNWVSVVNFGWDNGPALTFDANGYPNNILSTSNHNAVVSVGLSSQYPAGTQFEITWDGDPAGVTVDSATTVGGVLTYTRSNSNYTNALVRIWKNGISNLRFRRVGNPTTGIFVPEWVQRNKRYSVLRFMGWSKTNDARASYPVTSGNWGLQEYAGETVASAHKLRAWGDFLTTHKQ